MPLTIIKTIQRLPYTDQQLFRTSCLVTHILSRSVSYNFMAFQVYLFFVFFCISSQVLNFYWLLLRKLLLEHNLRIGLSCPVWSIELPRSIYITGTGSEIFSSSYNFLKTNMPHKRQFLKQELKNRKTII